MLSCNVIMQNEIMNRVEFKAKNETIFNIFNEKLYLPVYRKWCDQPSNSNVVVASAWLKEGEYAFQFHFVLKILSLRTLATHDSNSSKIYFLLLQKDE